MSRQIYQLVKAIVESRVERVKCDGGFAFKADDGQMIPVVPLLDRIRWMTGVERARASIEQAIRIPGHMLDVVPKRLAAYEAFIAENPDSLLDMDEHYNLCVNQRRAQLESVIAAKQQQMIAADPSLAGCEFRKDIREGYGYVFQQVWKDERLIAEGATSEEAVQKASIALAAQIPVYARTFRQFMATFVPVPVVPSGKKGMVIDNGPLMPQDTIERIGRAVEPYLDGQTVTGFVGSLLKNDFLAKRERTLVTFVERTHGPVLLVCQSSDFERATQPAAVAAYWRSEVRDAYEQGRQIPEAVLREAGIETPPAPAKRVSAGMGL